jgi:sigma-54 specific flagellar transcriptional regulator A
MTPKSESSALTPSGITARIAIFIEPQDESAKTISWDKLGTVVAGLSELYRLAREGRLDIILVDERRQEMNNNIATKLRRSNGLTEIWTIAEGDTVPEPREYVDGFMSRDLEQAEIAKKLKQILADKELLARYQIIARSSAMKAVARIIDRIAPTDVSVLVVGPSGSGKELVARALHHDSPRKDRPFVEINCAAIAEGVLESELFGHEKGAFTGAVTRRDGLFSKAEGGTIFLDEIGETKPDTQVKLLRFLEDGTFYPVGSSTSRRANVRVVAATNRDLVEAIAERQFREDLYFRLSVVKIVLPPLLHRKGDIQPLLQIFNAGHPELDYSDSALDLLRRYDWPGNVRQLKNFATRAAALKPKGLIGTEDVEAFISEQHMSKGSTLPVSTGRTVEEAGQELIYRAILSLGNEVRLLRDLITSHLPSEAESGDITAAAAARSAGTMDEMERVLIEKALAETKGNRKETARRLGIGERTLYRKLGKYKLR